MRPKKKTRTIPYRLKDRVHGFTLEIGSDAYKLWNHHKIKKKENKLTMWEIARMAREKLSDTHQNETFILSMIAQHGSDQKAHDRMFELALERYHELRKQGLGQVPVLPHGVPSPRIEEPKTDERVEPQIQQTVERKPDIVPQMPQALEKIYLDFPPSLRDLLTFEYDEPSRRIKIKGKGWIGEPVLTEIRNIVEKHQGRWVRGEHWTQSFWVIPLNS